MSGPKRHESDANFRIPPEVLEEVSRRNEPTPELAEAMRANQDGPPLPPELAAAPCTLCHDAPGPGPDEDTMESCPMCRVGMVSLAVARAYRAAHPADSGDTYVDEGVEIDLTTDPDEEESP